MTQAIFPHGTANTFIFEGIDFSGKSTVSKYFAEKLKEKVGEENVYWSIDRALTVDCECKADA